MSHFLYLMTLLFAVALILMMPKQSLAVSAGEHPVIIELFTSQGCSSCPPADRLVGQLADQPGFLVLSYHVDYWNNLGWEDPYSSKQTTARQYQYATKFGRGAYTPQAIVEGTYDVVGSDASGMKAAIAQAQKDPWVPVKVTPNGSKTDIRVDAGQAGTADVILVRYKKFASNAVPRGENAGRNLEHRNSVVEIRMLGQWKGDAFEASTDAPGEGEGIAVLLQSSDTGRLLGAGWL